LTEEELNIITSTNVEDIPQCAIQVHELENAAEKREVRMRILTEADETINVLDRHILGEKAGSHGGGV
jgi:hypothetical protein